MTINKARKALNEACIGWFHENCYLVRGIFLVWEMSIFCAAGRGSILLPFSVNTHFSVLVTPIVFYLKP